MDTLLLNVARATLNARSAEELTRELFAVLAATTGLESFFLSRIDVGANTFEIVVTHNATPAAIDVPEGLALAWSDSVCQHALAAGVQSTQQADGLWNHVRVVHELNISTYIVEPLHDPAGAVIGAVCGVSPRRTAVGADDLLVLDFCARLIAEQLRRDAGAPDAAAGSARPRQRIGALPALASYRALEDALEHMLEVTQTRGGAACAVCLDLRAYDAWRQALALEELLVDVVRRLTEALHADEFIARHDEHEFVAITRLPRKAGRTVGVVFGERLAAALWEPFERGALPPGRIEVCFGAAVAEPGETGSALIGRARASLRAAQTAGER